MSENPLYSVVDRIATITLNNPETRNALPPEVGAEIVRMMHAADNDPTVKCVLMRATGDNFSAGGDIKSFKETLDLSPAERYDQFERRVFVGNRLPNSILECSKPVVIATRGAVAGAGMALCLAADYVIAAESTYFLAAHVHIGLSIDCGLSNFMVAAMGVKAAKRLALLGERVKAHEALTLGMVTEVVAESELDARVAKVTAQLVIGPATAMAKSKQLLNRAAYPDLSGQFAAEANAIAHCVASDDFVKGVEGMLNKKPVTFD
jgi:enoyl-CoA hydratase/carnithine racemase